MLLAAVFFSSKKASITHSEYPAPIFSDKHYYILNSFHPVQNT